MDAVSNQNLTEQQKWALYQLVTGVRNKKLNQQSLGGYAGTGKTFIVKYLVKFFPNFAVAAYTGKAANVLRKKGISATTIHSRIYTTTFDDQGVTFYLNPDPGCEGFIIDEASMVSQDIYEDLKGYGLPLIFIGDHGQLEPVDSKLNLMEKPDYTLEEIHRNAGDIAKFAEHLRTGLASRGFKGKDGSVNFLPGRALDTKTLMEADQIICAFNKTRIAINTQIRSALGFSDDLQVGDRVMCLKNDSGHKIFNGMQGIVRRIYKKRSRSYMDFEFDGTLFPEICYDPSSFGNESYTTKQGKDAPIPFDYAYCITAHKSQGDEWDNVLVIEQQCKNWSHKRWAYTAASRAKKTLKWKSG
jgi:exodeoxyribonuclease-5